MPELSGIEFMEKVRKRFQEAETAEAENRRLALDDIKHLNGEQWPEKLRKERDGNGRPCLVLNRLPSFIDQIVGDQRQNRFRIKVRPVDDQSDPETAELIEGLIRNIEYISHADAAYDTAFEHAASHGFGFIRATKDYVGPDTFDQNLLIQRIKNPFCVYSDPQAQEADGSDVRYRFVTEALRKEDCMARFPKATLPSDVNVSNSTGTAYEGWFLADRVRIAEYWERNPVETTLVQISNGVVMRKDELTEEVLLSMAQQDPETGAVTIPQIVKERTTQTWEVLQYIVSGIEALSGPTKWDGEYIPVVPVYGKELNVDGKTIYRGVIRHAKDPQRQYNYWRSAITETVALSPKAPWVATTDQVAGYEAIWQTANTKPYSYLPYNHISGVPIPQRTSPAPIPTGAFNEAQVAVDDMKATTGIYDASLGNRSNETSGKAIIERKRQGGTATFAFVDNLSRAIQLLGKILVQAIPKVYDTERIVRIMNIDGTDKMIPINKPGLDADELPVILNDLTVGKYDVVVEAGPAYATQRAETAESILGFMQAIPQQAPLMADLAAKNMDWPDAQEIAARLRKTLPQGLTEPKEGEEAPPAPETPPPDPVAQMAQEIEMERIRLEYAKLENEKMKIEIDRLKIEAEIEKERIRFAGATAGGTY